MKHLSTYILTIFILLISSTINAQKADFPEIQNILKSDSPTPKASDTNEILWSEDFHSGFESENGSWTLGLQHGELWFKTTTAFYSPISALTNASPLYENKLPLFYENTQLISSPTRTNGIAMIDADRWNSTATVQFPDGTPTTNPVFASLESPAINLSGNPYSILSFYTFSKMCCSNFSGFIKVQFSHDGGENWTDLGFEDQLESDIGEPNDQSMTFDLSEILEGVSDLSDCRVKFLWNGGYSHFFWMLDDITIESLPANDLVAGKTFFNNYFAHIGDFQTNQISAVEYYKSLEYNAQPDFLTHPLNFGMVVTNFGSTTQNSVVLGVTAHAPSGDTPEIFLSDPVSIAPGQTDTLTINNVLFSQISAEIEPGDYVFDFIVNQEFEDSNPDNNIGESKIVTITSGGETGNTLMQNAEFVYDDTYVDDGQDMIYGSVYGFPQATNSAPKVITHVEAVFLYDQNYAETVLEEVVYFNVRLGSVLKELVNVPSTITTTVFDSQNPLDYSDIDLEYEIEQSDLWNANNSNGFVWTAFELPNPILIDPTKVYQAEFRIPASGTNIVFQPVDFGEEPFASVRYDYSLSDWVALSSSQPNQGAVLPIRFRINNPTSIEKISVENGLELVQNYPNPFSDATTIQFRTSETDNLDLEVRDLSGKLVFTKNFGRVTAGIPQTYVFQREDLAPGVYTYSIVSSEFVVTRKLTVIN